MNRNIHKALLREIQADQQRLADSAKSVDLEALKENGLMIHYLDRVRIHGEAAAMQWANERSATD